MNDLVYSLCKHQHQGSTPQRTPQNFWQTLYDPERSLCTLFQSTCAMVLSHIILLQDSFWPRIY